MLTIIKDGKFTGAQYDTDTEELRNFHEAQGDICVEYGSLEPTELDEFGIPVRWPDVPAELLAENHTVNKNKRLAKIERNAAEQANIEVLGVSWQVDDVARDRMQRTIDTATRNNVDVSTTVDWILADNTIRATTVSELTQVLDAHAYRTQDIFSQYNAWRAGSMTEIFVYF